MVAAAGHLTAQLLVWRGERDARTIGGRLPFGLPPTPPQTCCTACRTFAPKESRAAWWVAASHFPAVPAVQAVPAVKVSRRAAPAWAVHQAACNRWHVSPSSSESLCQNAGRTRDRGTDSLPDSGVYPCAAEVSRFLDPAAVWRGVVWRHVVNHHRVSHTPQPRELVGRVREERVCVRVCARARVCVWWGQGASQCMCSRTRVGRVSHRNKTHRVCGRAWIFSRPFSTSRPRPRSSLG